MKNILCFILFYSISSLNIAVAISDMEQLRTKAKKEMFYNSLGFGFSGKRGNVDKSAYNASLFSSINTEKWLIFLNGDYEYEEVREVKNADQSFLHLRVNYKINNANSFEAYTQYGRNPFRSLVHRLLYGLGFRREFSENTSFGIGAFYEAEKFKIREDNQIRANIYFSNLIKISESSDISNTLYYQPKIENFEDRRALFKITLNMKVSEHVSARIGAVWNYDSMPEENINTSDLSYVSGLNFNF